MCRGPTSRATEILTVTTFAMIMEAAPCSMWDLPGEARQQVHVSLTVSVEDVQELHLSAQTATQSSHARNQEQEATVAA